MRNTHCATYGAQEVVRVPGPYPEGMTNVNDATALRALSHPLRLRILAEMWDEGRPLRAADLAERLDVPANSVSYHVRRLRKAGFVLDAEPPQGATARDRWYLAPERGIVFKSDDPETVQAFAEVMRPRYMTVLDGLMKAQQAQAGPALHADGTVWLPESTARHLAHKLEELLDQVRREAAQAHEQAAPDTPFNRYVFLLDLYPELRHGERLTRPARDAPPVPSSWT